MQHTYLLPTRYLTPQMVLGINHDTQYRVPECSVAVLAPGQAAVLPGCHHHGVELIDGCSTPRQLQEQQHTAGATKL